MANQETSTSWQIIYAIVFHFTDGEGSHLNQATFCQRFALPQPFGSFHLISLNGYWVTEWGTCISNKEIEGKNHLQVC